MKDIDNEIVAYEPLMVTPYGLCISFPDYDAALKLLKKTRCVDHDNALKVSKLPVPKCTG